MVVDDGDPSEGRLDALGSDTDHLAVDGCEGDVRGQRELDMTSKGEVSAPRYWPGLTQARDERKVSDFEPSRRRAETTHSFCQAADPPCMISSTGTSLLLAALFFRLSCSSSSSARCFCLPLALSLPLGRSDASEATLECLRLRLVLSLAGAAVDPGLMTCGGRGSSGRVSGERGRRTGQRQACGRTALSDFQLDEGATGATTFLPLAIAGSRGGETSLPGAWTRPVDEAVLSTGSHLSVFLRSPLVHSGAWVEWEQRPFVAGCEREWAIKLGGEQEQRR